MELLGMVLTIIFMFVLMGIVSTGVWLLIYIGYKSLFDKKCDCKCSDKEEGNKL